MLSHCSAARAPSRTAWALVLALAAAVGCRNGHESGFRVESSNLSGSLGTPHEPSAPVVLRLSRDVDAGTVGIGSVFIRSASGAVAPAAVTRSPADPRTIDVLADPPLASGGRFELVVTQDLQSTAGEPLAGTFVRGFVTTDRRSFGPPLELAPGFARVRHVAVDAEDTVYALVGQSSQGGATRLHSLGDDLAQRDPPDFVPGSAASLGLGGDFGRPDGGLVVDGLGATLQRTFVGVWTDPLEIPVQPRPADLPLGASWPDPFRYRFRPGGSVSSGVRIGPLFRSMPDPGAPTGLRPLCRVVTPTATYETPYGVGEEVWDALVSTALPEPFVLGAGDVGFPLRSAWITRPGTAERTFLGPVEGVYLASGMATEPFGHAVAAWITLLPNTSGVPSFTTELQVATYVPAGSRVGPPGFRPAIPIQRRRQVEQPTPEIRVAAAGNGDAVLAWTLADPGPNSTLRVAHYVETRGAWSLLPDLSDRLPGFARAFDVALDPHGHAVLAWAELTFGTRFLFAQRYDAVLDVWEDPELVFSSASEDVADVHVVADSQGRFTMVWSQGGGAKLRRFQ